jgi:hypothetical protein
MQSLQPQPCRHAFSNPSYVKMQEAIGWRVRVMRLYLWGN